MSGHIDVSARIGRVGIEVESVRSSPAGEQGVGQIRAAENDDLQIRRKTDSRHGARLSVQGVARGSD